jgi:uncharacterized membrane protein
MWWIQTSGYHLAGLIWLIVIAAAVVIALVALSTAGAAANSARRTKRVLRDYEARQFAAGAAASQMADPRVNQTMAPPPNGVVAPAAVAPEGPQPVAVPSEQRPDPGLGDSMRILHERYARGEITREEYLRAREDMMAMAR